MTPDRREERKSGEAGLGHKRLSEWLHLIMPSRYIGAIYALFLFFLGLYVLLVVTGKSNQIEKASSKEISSISYEPYTGVTDGDIVQIDENIPNLSIPKRIYKGQKYKVFVILRSYYEPRVHYIKEYYFIGKYAQSYRFVPILSEKVEGPAIICTGRNNYAFIDAPSVEHIGFLHLNRIETNKISTKGSWAPDLDTSLYSTDCQPPDKAVIGQLESLFNIRLPVAD